MDLTHANPSHGLKEPQRLAFESAKIRRLVLCSYWAIVILALPFWWRLTSIERTALPSGRVVAQLDRKLVFPVHIQLDAPSFENDFAEKLSRVLSQILHASPTGRNLDIRVDIGRSAGMKNKVGGWTQLVIILIGEASNAYTVVLGDYTAVQRHRKLLVSPEDASGGLGRYLYILSASCSMTVFQSIGWPVFCRVCLRPRSPRYRHNALFNTVTAIGLLSRC